MNATFFDWGCGRYAKIHQDVLWFSAKHISSSMEDYYLQIGNIHELFAGAATWMSACVVSICSRNSDEGDNSVLDMRSTEKKEERGAMCEEVISA